MPRLTAIRCASIAAAAAILAAGGHASSAAQHEKAGHASVAAAHVPDLSVFDDLAGEINEAIEESEKLLADSVDKLPDRDAAEVLAEAIDVAESHADDLASWKAGYREHIELGGAAVSPSYVIGQDAAVHIEALRAGRAEVSRDVTAWRAEQQRLEQQRRAAEAAAAAARATTTTPTAPAAGAKRTSTAGSSATAATPAPSRGALSVRSIGAANQRAIDSCVGFGDTTGWLGVPSFSVHWHCGGARIAALRPGALLVVENGQYAGTWRANGLAYRLNGAIHDTHDIRRLGGLQIQTCIGGSYSSLGYYSFTRIG